MLVTRATFKRKFENKNLLIYNNERLVQNPELVMKAFAENIGIEFEYLLKTIGEKKLEVIHITVNQKELINLLKLIIKRCWILMKLK